MPQASSALGRLCKLPACRVQVFCCGCKLRTGVILTSVLFFLNACFAFAGEAALYFGMLSAVSEQAGAGDGMIAPGTRIDDPKIQAALIAMGLYTLTASILGFVAAFRRHLCSATAFYAMNVLDFILNVGIGVISWFAGASFTSLLAQIPSLAIAGYFLVVVKSYRQELLAEKAGGSGGMASSSRGGGGVISHGEDEDDEDGVNAADLAGVAGGSASSGGGRGKQVQVAIADDDEDGDISRGGRVTKL